MPSLPPEPVLLLGAFSIGLIVLAGIIGLIGIWGHHNRPEPKMQPGDRPVHWLQLADPVDFDSGDHLQVHRTGEMLKVSTVRGTTVVLDTYPKLVAEVYADIAAELERYW